MDTARTQLDTARHCWTHLGHSPPRPHQGHQVRAWAHRRVWCLPRPRSEGLGWRAMGRPGSGNSQGQHQEPLRGSITGSTRVAPCSPIHTPGPTRGQRTRLGPNITALLGPCQAGFYALTKKLPINDKSPGFCPTLKPSAGALGAGQDSCTRQEVLGLLSGRQPGLCSPGPL